MPIVTYIHQDGSETVANRRILTFVLRKFIRFTRRWVRVGSALVLVGCSRLSLVIVEAMAG